MAAMLVRLTRETDRTNVINPRLEVSLLGLAGVVSGPRHHDLRGARERKQSLAAPDADRLKIGDLLRARQRVRSFAHVTETRGERLDRKFGQLRLLAARNTQAQADVKRDGQIHIRKLLLRVEIRRIGDHPPAINIRVNVPYDMLMA